MDPLQFCLGVWQHGAGHSCNESSSQGQSCSWEEVVQFWSCVLLYLCEKLQYITEVNKLFSIKDKIGDILGLVAIWFIMG